MVSKNRYIEKEEQLLRDLKSENPGKSWEAIAELYNARIGDKSRMRTGLALQMKFKKMQAREKRPAMKALDERGKQEVLSVEERMHQSWTAPSPLPGAGFPLNEQCVTANWATTSLSLSEPREDVEYEISLLQWHLGTMLDELCSATAFVLDSLKKNNDNLRITRASLSDAQASLQGMQAMRMDLQATKSELQSANANLEATKAELEKCRESLDQEKARCKVADGAAETAYEAAHKSGALADELRRELRAAKGEDSSPMDSHKSSTADLALELILAQQTVAYLEQMLQVRDPGYIREQVQQSLAVAEQLKRQVQDLTNELHETKEENERLKALEGEEQDVKRMKTRKMRKLEV
ncbi:hypothetical protein B0J12DRAFT_747562 [Macrophomina phaseolina]|uniref:Myb-like domain-containing protein n=1 Tax=Macrophomina phaseolina TaxID=35725 RepID=A0ABQ8FSQ1_9PEZI|nr:hypothetical protein B0J12DRAFT_747562 [Macrophomina phaseolina]